MSNIAEGYTQPEGTFERLQTLLVTVAAIDSFLQEVAVLAASLTSPPVSCGITVRYDGRPLTVSSSDGWADSLDETQYTADEGPCLQAMRTGQPVEVTSMRDEHRWPSYTPEALAKGLQSSLSMPMIVTGNPIGAVNFYTSDPDQEFTGDVRTRTTLFTAQASTALLLATRQLGQLETNRQLEEALGSRSTIDQAIGIIMGLQGCTADAAFDVLRKHSQNNNIRLRDVAADLVRRTAN